MTPELAIPVVRMIAIDAIEVLNPRERSERMFQSIVASIKAVGEVERQRRMVRKADFAQQRLLFIAEALHQLLADEHFFNLLRAERLDTMPAYLADRVWSKGSTDE
jgi:ParB family chromosome partitioning protein